MEWIDIKNQLPENEEYVICNERRVNQNNRITNSVGHYKHFEKGEFMSIFHLQKPSTCLIVSKDGHGEQITHWMRFPKPITE